MTTGVRKAGEFCWINILTPKPDQAREFFTRLLGWNYVDMPGMGHRVQVGGRDIGGLFDLEAPTTPAGTPPCIGVMVKVDSADTMGARVSALGGTAKPAFDVGPAGRMAECHDPNGANIDLWEPKQSQGMDADSTTHGVPSWFETLTTDTDRATKFYQELFGWTSEVNQMPGVMYTTFKLGGESVAGMMQTTPEMGPIPPHWGVYFTVNDADKAASTTQTLGGTVFIPPQDIPNVGRFCGLISPQGVRFYALKYTS